jgi:beta-aspartyl-peptidase (threonine type)
LPPLVHETRRDKPGIGRMSGWRLIVHGGAKEIEPGEERENIGGLRRAIAAGKGPLAQGGTALDAVEAAVRVLEDLPVFNAGRGSATTSLGAIEMSAAIMDGATLDVGAVASLQRVRNPVSVARALLHEYEVLLVGAGAETFADQAGAERCSQTFLTETARSRSSEHDTVGAIARDSAGHFAVAISTGGLPGQRPGRVGDSPMPGCGFYAEDGVGAVALSGHGEGIARLALASRIFHALHRLGADGALSALEQMHRVTGDAGAIAIDADGRMAFDHNSQNFAVASIAQGDETPRICLRKD